MKEWKNAETSSGVFQGEIQLSDLANIGEWKIAAKVGADVSFFWLTFFFSDTHTNFFLVIPTQKKNKTFEVREYVPPKFEVSIELAKDFALKDGKIKAIINAKYMYGKKLRGKATVSIKEIRDGCFRHEDNSEDDKTKPLSTIIINIDGRGCVEFDIKKDLQFNVDQENNEIENYSEVFKMTVDVIENLTGL